mmetsp:Transcript_29183/g.79865  ORF Transcript_29183/g.79865 Transcript_29183/m.79865 type:complete len:722 (+) Transcript_29183:224-2389(+)
MSKAKVWSLVNGSLMQTIDCGGWVHSVSFADGSFLATGDQRKMASLWHVASGELVYELECPGEVHSVAISPDKRTLLVGDGSGRGHKWVTASGACLQSIECGTGEVIALDMSYSHRYVATGGIGKTAVVWDLWTGEQAFSFVHDGMVMAVAFSADGNELATGIVMGKAHIWDLTMGALMLQVQVCKGPVFCVMHKTSSEGRPILVTGDVTGKTKIWALDSVPSRHKAGDELRSFDCGSAVRGLDLSQDGTLLASGNKMGEAIIWDAMSGAKLRTMMCGGMVYSVDLSFDKHLLATGDQCKEAKVWNVSTGALVHTLTCDEVVKRVDLAGDSSLLATGTGESCKIWDVASGCLIHTQETGGRVRLASDKSIVVTVNGHGLLSAWQLLDEKVVSFWTRIARHPTALNSAIRCVPSFELVLYGSSPSGRSVTAHASASDNFVLLSTLLGTSSSAGTAAGAIGSCVLRTDCTGWHALDYALKNRNAKLAELLLSAAFRSPPAARDGLVNAPTEMVPSLVMLARLFPSATRRQLSALGLDPYPVPAASRLLMSPSQSSSIRPPCIRRVPQHVLVLDNFRMSIACAESPYPDDTVWERLTGLPSYHLDQKAPAQASAPVISSLQQSSQPAAEKPKSRWLKVAQSVEDGPSDNSSSGLFAQAAQADIAEQSSVRKSPVKKRRGSQNQQSPFGKSASKHDDDEEIMEGEDEVDCLCGAMQMICTLTLRL